MLSSLFLFILLLFHPFLVEAQKPITPPPKCSLGKRPIHSGLFGRRIVGAKTCTPSGVSNMHALRLERWAVIYEPFPPPNDINGNINIPACREEIVSLFSRGKTSAFMIYYRPAVLPAFFERNYPRLYEKSLRDFTVKFPCEKVPLKKFAAWGNNRGMFADHLKRMYWGILKMRNTHCHDDYGGTKTSWSRKEMELRIMRERITTSALTYLDSVAFNSFLCS